MTASLSAFLDDLRALPSLRVVLDGHHHDSGGFRLFVGCGVWPAEGEPIPADQLILNNKGTFPRFARNYDSVARLAAEPPPGLFEGWAALWTQWPLPPATVLAQVTLVVEDISPDSVFGVLLLLARMAGVDLGPLGAAWTDAVDRWERTGHADDPWTDGCALASALGHSRIPPGAGELPADALAATWADVLRFVADCLAHGAAPHAIPNLSGVPSWNMAMAALRQEEATYLGWLNHAAVVQLSVPLAGMDTRRLLVDGLLFVEDQATGTAKVFYRNDRDRAPLGRGFTLSAHYRPDCTGSGNDVTIAVDVRAGIHLRDLWAELERRENAAWNAAGEERPSTKPRALRGVESRHDQPWYITPDGTLIGAPRVLDDGRLGTKLSWDDVRAAVWTAFNPVQDIRVETGTPPQSVPLMDMGRLSHEEAGKTLLLTRWPRPSGGTAAGGGRALSSAPVVRQVLASLVMPQGAGPQGMDTLPPAGSWEEVNLNGGFAIVTDTGLFVLDDWRERPLPMDGIRNAFTAAARLDDRLLTIERDTIRPLVEEVERLLRHPQRWPNLDRPLQRAAWAGSQLTTIRGTHALPPADPDARLVRDALARRWGLDARLAALEAEVAAIETSLRSLTEAKLARVGRFIALYAFPVMVADVFGPTIGKSIYPWTTDAPVSGDPPALFLLAVITGVFIVVLIALHLYLRLNGRDKR